MAEKFMVETVEHIDWLCDRDRLFPQLAKQLYLELIQFSHWETPPKIILAEREPVRFLAGFIAACTANCSVFLCNPDWAKQEWEQVFDLVQPDIIWGIPRSYPEAGNKVFQSTIQNPSWKVCYGGRPSWQLSAKSKIQNHIMIPTGGSSGKIKFAIHTWETLMASVRGFTEYFQLDKVNSFCVLPLYHVSGLMQFMRSFATGGKFTVLSFKELESGLIDNSNISDFFISLVPTQLQRLLQNSELTEWLSQFQTVLLGGAPAWNELLEAARRHKIHLAPTYGMTETASQIATLKPNDFLIGKDSCVQILPHAKVRIHNEQGEVINSNQIGNINIYSPSLALGYYPNVRKNQESLQVDDLGFFDDQGYLHIVGRSSDKIITGGENVYAIEVELAMRATTMVEDVCVIGIPDRLWGQAVTAIYIPKNPEISHLQIKVLLKEKISKFKIPKYWIPVETLPRTSQGKVNRQQLQQIAKNFHNS